MAKAIGFLRALSGEWWVRRRRRWALWLATVGIDAGPRHIHGMRVVAAR